MLSFFKKKDNFQEAAYFGIQKHFLKLKNSFKFFSPDKCHAFLKEKCEMDESGAHYTE